MCACARLDNATITSPRTGILALAAMEKSGVRAKERLMDSFAGYKVTGLFYSLIVCKQGTNRFHYMEKLLEIRFER